MPDSGVRQARAIASRYRLVRELGRGGMGSVWQAHDEVLARDVAVKRVYFPVHAGPEARDQAARRIRRWARATARLRHPSVIRVHDVVDDSNDLWIVMELLQVESLEERLDRLGQLPEREAARIVLHVLDALRVAHAAGIVHRDIRPGNILLGPDGEVVLTDFGIAPPAGYPTITTRGTIVGSLSYMAPERIRGEEGGPESDLWSLGATLFAAVEGEPPYDRRDPVAALTQEPPPVQRTWLLRPAILGLLRRDQAARISAEEAINLLTIAVADLEREIMDVPDAVGGSGEFAWFARSEVVGPESGQVNGERVRKPGAHAMTAWDSWTQAVREKSARWAAWVATTYGAADAGRPRIPAGRHVRKSRVFALLGLPDPGAQVGFSAAVLSMAAAALVALSLPVPVPWLVALPPVFVALLILATPVLPETLAPGAGWPRWVLVGGALLPFVGGVALLVPTSSVQIGMVGAGVWLGYLSVLTWRLSPVAAVAPLVASAVYLVSVVVVLVELYSGTPLLRLPAALLLAQVGALAAAWWSAWAASVVWRRARPDGAWAFVGGAL
ncbi:hypothetical protein Aph01nite_69520 [Acrocarpospora phusangensis]|uniref:non-specific serine/threonine protein kinase n=1 Tax=Acrocarpospora phusangensis TaxID=1070424 RepID=A0A919QGQ8_9ACTN|nr:serine/threonine-protein kinase [Acrocarpospora phusangensis]GIH28642.1 hypothetical protein Aph01nite_69520 [Acrocarpospora phusangensis]